MGDHGYGLARRLVAGVWSFPPSPEKNTKTKETVVMRSGSTRWIFSRRRSRTNKDLTCTRIRALGQRRDKEIPKTPTTSSRALEDSSLGARDTTGRHEFTERRLAELSLGARHAGRGFEPSLPRVATPGPRRTPCVKYDSCA